MKADLIQKQWISYLEQVMPKDAPLTQVNEMRQAFFSGAGILFATILCNLSQEDSVEAEAQDAEIMNAIRAELEEFGLKIT